MSYMYTVIQYFTRTVFDKPIIGKCVVNKFSLHYLFPEKIRHLILVQLDYIRKKIFSE